MDTMEEIDSVLLPLFGSDGSNTIAISQDSRVHLLRDLRDKVKSIRFHLSNLFERNDELESGRDVLTRLLNRKFMPVVLSKQVSQSPHSENSLRRPCY